MSPINHIVIGLINQLGKLWIYDESNDYTEAAEWQRWSDDILGPLGAPDLHNSFSANLLFFIGLRLESWIGKLHHHGFMVRNANGFCSWMISKSPILKSSAKTGHPKSRTPRRKPWIFRVFAGRQRWRLIVMFHCVSWVVWFWFQGFLKKNMRPQNLSKTVICNGTLRDFRLNFKRRQEMSVLK